MYIEIHTYIDIDIYSILEFVLAMLDEAMTTDALVAFVVFSFFLLYFLF